jgi:hypothetical protein
MARHPGDAGFCLPLLPRGRASARGLTVPFTPPPPATTVGGGFGCGVGACCLQKKIMKDRRAASVGDVLVDYGGGADAA